MATEYAVSMELSMLDHEAAFEKKQQVQHVELERVKAGLKEAIVEEHKLIGKIRHDMKQATRRFELLHAVLHPDTASVGCQTDMPYACVFAEAKHSRVLDLRAQLQAMRDARLKKAQMAEEELHEAVKSAQAKMQAMGKKKRDFDRRAAEVLRKIKKLKAAARGLEAKVRSPVGCYAWISLSCKRPDHSDNLWQVLKREARQGTTSSGATAWDNAEAADTTSCVEPALKARVRAKFAQVVRVKQDISRMKARREAIAKRLEGLNGGAFVPDAEKRAAKSVNAKLRSRLTEARRKLRLTARKVAEYEASQQHGDETPNQEASAAQRVPEHTARVVDDIELATLMITPRGIASADASTPRSARTGGGLRRGTLRSSPMTARSKHLVAGARAASITGSSIAGSRRSSRRTVLPVDDGGTPTPSLAMPNQASRSLHDVLAAKRAKQSILSKLGAHVHESPSPLRRSATLAAMGRDKHQLPRSTSLQALTREGTGRMTKLEAQAARSANAKRLLGGIAESPNAQLHKKHPLARARLPDKRRRVAKPRSPPVSPSPESPALWSRFADSVDNNRKALHHATHGDNEEDGGVTLARLVNTTIQSPHSSARQPHRSHSRASLRHGAQQPQGSPLANVLRAARQQVRDHGGSEEVSAQQGPRQLAHKFSMKKLRGSKSMARFRN